MNTEPMWCNGKCSKKRQKQTPHTKHVNGVMVVYRCQVCGAEQEYRREAQK